MTTCPCSCLQRGHTTHEFAHRDVTPHVFAHTEITPHMREITEITPYIHMPIHRSLHTYICPQKGHFTHAFAHREATQHVFAHRKVPPHGFACRCNSTDTCLCPQRSLHTCHSTHAFADSGNTFLPAETSFRTCFFTQKGHSTHIFAHRHRKVTPHMILPTERSPASLWTEITKGARTLRE